MEIWETVNASSPDKSTEATEHSQGEAEENHKKLWSVQLIRKPKSWKSEGFWCWGVIICKIAFLDFVHISKL
jgi:hypothetical protein